MKRLTLRSSTIISVILIGVSFILLSVLAGNFFRQAALDAQITSMSRIIEIASHEILRDLQRHAINLAASINSENNLSKALHQVKNGADPKRIVEILDDPFITGFVGVKDVELTKVRTYDLELRPLQQSSRGDMNIPFEMPATLYAAASPRSGADRLKALSRLWLSPHGPRYSILLPIGGLRISGYTEIVFDPRFALRHVSTITNMPITILLPQEGHSVAPVKQGDEVLLPIEYTLTTEDGKAAYRMVGMEKINELNKDMLQTQWITVISFLTLIFGIMLLALWLLRIGLFAPLGNLMRGIQDYSQGKLETVIKPGGLQEIHTLGSTFNEMLQRIRGDIRELERLSTRDGLTGIPNRRFFDKCLEHQINHSRRRQLPLSMLYIDIDYFKLYNDHYGHQGGDEVLQQVAQCIASMARRETDVAARLGGEEFAILLPDTVAENARLLAEALLLAVAELEIKHEKSQVADHITLSIGVADILPDTDSKAVDLVARADEALYGAKAAGRNRVVVAG